jgi:membrane protease YdiL (CAAX protease family)
VVRGDRVLGGLRAAARTQNLPLFVDRLAFGLLAAILVWRTGGLEAGIAAHVVNNVCAYRDRRTHQFDRGSQGDQGDRWLDTVFDVGGFALFALLAYLFWTRLKLRRRVDLSAGV